MARNEIWEQWDEQEERRIENQRFIELNNTFLSIERGDEPLTITNSQRMLVLVGQLFGDCDFLADHWMNELQTLPNWINV